MISRGFLLAVALLGVVGLPAVAESESVLGDRTIVMPLSAADLGATNLLDLQGKTIRLTPSGSGYSAMALPLAWQTSGGQNLATYGSTEVALTGFAFPFSGKSWDRIVVNAFGTITFGAPQSAFYDGQRDRYLLFATYASRMQSGLVPIISPLFRRLGGNNVYALDADGVNRIDVLETTDRVIITWKISEPYREFQSFTDDPRLNEFQAVLYANGGIDLNYQTLAVEDGIVGVFPLESTQPVLAHADPVDSSYPAHVDLTAVEVSRIGSGRIGVKFTLRGAPLPAGVVRFNSYRISIDLDEPFMTFDDPNDREFEWFAGGTDERTWTTGGPGVNPGVTIDGNSLAITAGVSALNGVKHISFVAQATDHNAQAYVDLTTRAVLTLPDVPSPRVDLSAVNGTEVREALYEAFHYPKLPETTNLGCRAIGRFGDVFDFLVFYSDFRFDWQEAGSVSTGPVGTSVTGIHPGGFPSSAFCSEGRFQAAQYPSFIGTPIAAERTKASLWTNYGSAVNLLSHELGHRWLTVSKALVGSELITIGDVHWSGALHVPVAFPVSNPVEASLMCCGASWRDNGNGTFDALHSRDTGPPGYSYLDLYLMGLMVKEDVPPFFLIRNAIYANGKWSGQRQDITVDDVIAANGPRLPAFDQSQRTFTLGFVALVREGEPPSAILLERIPAIRDAFTSFFGKATGGIGRMTTPPLGLHRRTLRH